MFSHLSAPVARPRRRATRPQRVFDGRPHLLTATVEAAEQTAGLYTRLAGRAAPYNVFTPRWYFHLGIAPGAFDKTLAEYGAGLPLLLFHDNQRFPVGRALEWDGAGDGLDGLWGFDSSPTAQEAARLADEGFFTGLSVGMTALLSDWEYTPYDQWDPHDQTTWDKCMVIEARLDEVSMTATPGFQQAQIHYALDAPHRGRSRHAEARPHAASVQAWLDTMR
jgi:HK97 family phage prohead protease